MDKNNIKTSTPVSLTEHLSAVLDNEAGSFEQRRVLDELKSSNELRQKLSSYALIGETMRATETTAMADSNFLAGIHAQIESEDEYHQVQLKDVVNDKAVYGKRSSPAWLRPVGGFALAASVAAVAFLGFQNYETKDVMLGSGMTTAAMSSGNTLSEEKMAAATVIPASQIASSVQTGGETHGNSEYQQADARTRMLLKRYVDSHMQYASNTAFVPSVRVIAYAN